MSDPQRTSTSPTRFLTIWNMSFGFLGIQFGWGLQMANMSAIYEYLGADAHQIPMLWLAAPLTGLLVQPIVGHMSDRTWTRLGRRRPYFLVGALLASFALVAMPSSGTLWMAAGLLWVMDASINISMEPFRAFVADLLPPSQRTRGYAMQSLFIGLGAVIASMLPWLLYNVFPVGGDGRHSRGRLRDFPRHGRDAPDHATPGLGADLHLARPLLHVALLRRGRR